MVIIPALNEERAVGEVVRAAKAVLPDAPVLVIDDHSTDGTAIAAANAGAQVLKLPVHLGLGGAVQAGYKLAFEMGIDFVVRVDGDGQHDPADIPRILESLSIHGRRGGDRVAISGIRSEAYVCSAVACDCLFQAAASAYPGQDDLRSDVGICGCEPAGAGGVRE